jgi:predicted dehydrogenase
MMAMLKNYRHQQKLFYEVVAQKRPPSITGEDGLKALEVALAAYQSAQQQTVISLEHTL